jgi:GNAT superfamily N-acetyltransferase
LPGDLIRPAEGAADMAEVRALFGKYAAGLGVSLCFQDFDNELATLPGAYVPPRGGLWLAGPADGPCGCIALRPLPYGEIAGATNVAAGPATGTTDTAELKRLYVDPAARGRGLGRRLVTVALDHARRAGYRHVKLDTLAQMASARALYASLGFVPCAAYYHNPLGGTLYMERSL